VRRKENMMILDALELAMALDSHEHVSILLKCLIVSLADEVNEAISMMRMIYSRVIYLEISTILRTFMGLIAGLKIMTFSTEDQGVVLDSLLVIPQIMRM
jgi:hypothetical protein